MIDKKYIEPFQNMFKEQYETIHRLETNKLRNVAKFFAHLLHTDDISWGVSTRINCGPLWSWSYGSWIYNYPCNQCLSPLKLWVRISIRARCITLCDKVCQWLAVGQWFSSGTPVSSINESDRYDITEILLKLALNTINQTPKINCYVVSLY